MHNPVKNPSVFLPNNYYNQCYQMFTKDCKGIFTFSQITSLNRFIWRFTLVGHVSRNNKFFMGIKNSRYSSSMKSHNFYEAWWLVFWKVNLQRFQLLVILWVKVVLKLVNWNYLPTKVSIFLPLNVKVTTPLYTYIIWWKYFTYSCLPYPKYYNKLLGIDKPVLEIRYSL